MRHKDQKIKFAKKIASPAPDLNEDTKYYNCIKIYKHIRKFFKLNQSFNLENENFPD